MEQNEPLIIGEMVFCSTNIDDRKFNGRFALSSQGFYLKKIIKGGDNIAI